MTPEQLRASILQYAMQGKLTDQREEDGAVDDLLEQIAVEKEQLILDKKIKRDKELPPISEDEIPFQIPANWKWVRIGRIVRITAGGDKPSTISQDKTEAFPFPIFSNGEKNNGLFGYAAESRIDESALTVSGRGTIGFTAIRNPGFVPIVRLLVLRSIAGVNLAFLKYAIDAMLVKSTGTSIPQLTAPMTAKLTIPLPPLAEQERIVRKIQMLNIQVEEYKLAYDSLVQLNANINSRLNDSVLKYAMQGKLTNQREEDDSVEDLMTQIATEKEQLISDKKIKREKELPPISEDEVPFQIPSRWKRN
ncbi:restriction endonuclease subunit S [Weissella confusa]|uniref:restriction endonuclease subunit S n=1 Tax=Weissella confusa TaxID=1583 RepID=UPI00396F68AD